jgi:amidophosphoribosyltransferase
MCGIVGVVSLRDEEIALDLFMGAWSLQHRGQESFGIVTQRGGAHAIVREMGAVATLTLDRAKFGALRGASGISHVRYATAGGSTIKNAQPVSGVFRGKPFWLAHNGNLVGYEPIREELSARGYQFETDTDTEVIAALVAFSDKDAFESALSDALRKVRGTYALLALHEGNIFGVRDPSGNRPLVIGKNHRAFFLASESAAGDALGFQVLRDVGPGEMVVLDRGRQSWYRVEVRPGKRRECIFEYVYFLRPDSICEGRRVQLVREAMGEILARESPVSADIVLPVPDSGTAAATGFARASRIELCLGGLFRYHYAGRTFIEPTSEERKRGLRIKLNPIPELIAGKRVVVVDDSIVRANVMPRVVGILRECKAREVHVRISSPPYRYPCHYGIDTYRVENELAAVRCSGDVEAIRREIGADSLAYLSLPGLRQATTGDPEAAGFCDACFTGDYYIPIRA